MYLYMEISNFALEGALPSKGPTVKNELLESSVMLLWYQL